MKPRTATFLLIAVPLFTVGFGWHYYVSPVIKNARRAWLVSQEGYPLVGGYRYASFDGYRLLEKNNRRPLDIGGTHLNRFYFDDRFIVGEVIEKPKESDNYRRYSYFILDTDSEDYQSNLSLAEFESVLNELNILETVHLVGRDSDLWLEQQ